MDVAFNLWDADEYGDGSSTGLQLTAYLCDDDDYGISKFVSVSLSRDDFRAMADNPDTDDEWHYPNSPKHADLCALFVLYTVLEKGKD